MSWVYRRLIRPVLFSQDSEFVHEKTLELLGWAGHRAILCDLIASWRRAPKLPVKVCGLEFCNPIGLAAGMDKAGEAVPVWEAMGFGFCELGGVTWQPQPGNARPRMFRVQRTEALINRMGFNNPGAAEMAARLQDWRLRGLWPTHPVGVNLGKSKDTPLTQAAEEYARSLQVLLPYANFFVVNVSSPNTPNLRQLQNRSCLEEIFQALEEVQGTRESSDDAEAGRSLVKPIFIKVSPDLSFSAFDEILELTETHAVAGLIATNTTTFRRLSGHPEVDRPYSENGGLSGRPLRVRSTEVIRHLAKQTRGRLPIIGVGGVFCADDAWEKIIAGASLIQIYTGLVYEGPGIVQEILLGLQERLNQCGFTMISEAVGIDA